MKAGSKHWIMLNISVLILALSVTGCGYTRQVTLPAGIKSIHVDTVQNAVPIAQIYTYQQGIEMDITNAIIRRLQVDGNLKVAAAETADAILKAKMVRFEQEGLRFTSLESVSEYRLYIVLSLELIDTKTGNVIWSEPNFSGDSEYRVSEIRSLSREEAAQKAVDRLARNVVDRIVEDW